MLRVISDSHPHFSYTCVGASAETTVEYLNSCKRPCVTTVPHGRASASVVTWRGGSKSALSSRFRQLEAKAVQVKCPQPGVLPNDGTIFSDLAEFLLPTTGLDQSDGSAFFHQKAVRLLSALLAHLHHAGKEGHLFAAANRELSKPPARMV